jgi:hypothetical protein
MTPSTGAVPVPSISRAFFRTSMVFSSQPVIPGRPGGPGPEPMNTGLEKFV